MADQPMKSNDYDGELDSALEEAERAAGSGGGEEAGGETSTSPAEELPTLEEWEPIAAGVYGIGIKVAGFRGTPLDEEERAALARDSYFLAKYIGAVGAYSNWIALGWTLYTLTKRRLPPREVEGEGQDLEEAA